MRIANDTALGNPSRVTQFIFLGFSQDPATRVLFGVGLSFTYTLSLAGNSVLLLLTALDPALHTPMYFFLCNLSFLEACYTTVTIPKMLASVLAEGGTISFLACAAQMQLVLSLGTAECYLLAAMAYDRYRAICSPLHYPLLMNPRACATMATACWLCGILLPMGKVIWIFSMPYCGPNEIHHFFCDIHPVLRLACADTSRSEVFIVLISFLITVVPFLTVLVSYACIICTVLKSATAEGRHKAFSTCSSHLTVVVLFYGSACAMYLRPKAGHVAEVDRVMALLYTVVTPTLNPLIYSLRNQEVKAALRRLGGRKRFRGAI
ncbi:olfactory receptor 10A5-like [Pelodiscus sinensis]|uniref:olfactory receptor 10A5-like n=1 Tax=Pelodiscus sinensis TaxID=13735 RepID=UPI003F6C9D2B